MNEDRRALLGLGAAAVASALPLAAHAASRTAREMPLWPGDPPGGPPRHALKPTITERSTSPAFHDRIAEHTAAPCLAFYPAARPNGAAMLLVPGGGYRWAVVDKEGVDIANVLTGSGVGCFVLRYRLPGDGWPAGPDTPLQDTQRAMRVIRARAGELGLDPARVGVLGASAGGHMAATLLSGFDRSLASATDAADRLSARPDFGVLLYPVVTMAEPLAHPGSRRELLGAHPSPEAVDATSCERHVGGREPPVFLVHALDDTSVPVENSLMLLDAYRRAKVPIEAHLYEEGGHGFGIRLAEGKPARAWTDAFVAWAGRRGYLG